MLEAADPPCAGDIVWLDFGSPVGREQAGRRPAVVLSSHTYNVQSALIVVCPITRNVGPWPFKVEMPQVGRLKSAILVDRIRSVDRGARSMRLGELIPTDILDQVYARVETLFGRFDTDRS